MREPTPLRTTARAALTVLCAALVASAGACVDSTASGSEMEEDAPRDVARTVVAIVDFSGSQPAHSSAEAQQYLEEVIEELGFGDRLVLLEMYRSGPRDSVGRFVQQMPDPRRADAVTSFDRRELRAARRGVLNALPIFFDPDLVRSVPTTDLLTTLHIAAEHLRDAPAGERQVLLLSDMYQSTPQFEFEGARRMPPERWVETQAREGALPSLEGACVLVIGADHTTPEGQRVRRFWEGYFDAAGARLGEGSYRLRAPTGVVGC